MCVAGVASGLMFSAQNLSPSFLPAGSFEPFQEPFLGTSAKSSSLVDFEGNFLDTGTGEIVLAKPEHDPAVSRLERFALQSASRQALRYTKVSRVARCLRVRRKDKAAVEVYRSVEYGTAHYGGLQTCGSVWVCPVCAAKISERRKAELLSAIEQHKAGGGDALLLTLTTPHHLGDNLAEVVAGQKQALVYFNGGKAAQALYMSIGCIGQVRVLEVTNGRLRAVNNGWHPHYHILLFVRSGLDLDVLQRSFYARWASSCKKAGLPVPSFEHGLRLDDGSKAASYVSKWGLESEMTKGHIKKAKDGETPFDLLRAFLHDDDKQAAALFREFAEVFKGKRQLFWSPGLKAKFAVEEVSDEDAAASQEERAELLGRIELEDWRLILKYDVRGEVLELARHGWESVERLLDGLRRTDEVKNYGLLLFGIGGGRPKRTGSYCLGRT